MQIEKTTPAVWYCITCTAPVTVSAELNCIPVTLASLDQEGQATFCAPCKEVTIETGGTYTVLPTEAPGAQPFGGYVNRNLTIGHAARAAVCTLTAGDMAQGGSLTDGTHTVTLAVPANGYGWAGIADATAAGSITFAPHEAVELPAAPATYATGGMVIVDATKGGTLTIGEWSKTFAAAQGAKASGTFYHMGGNAVAVNGTPVAPPADTSSVEGWSNAFLTAGVGLVCTAVDQHGEIEVSVEAAEPGTAGNSITISVETYPDVTLSGGTDGRTVAALLAELEADTDFPCTLVHDGEGNVTLTAKVAGTAGNYSMSCTDADFISTDTELAGGQDARTTREVVDAIADAAAGYLNVWLDADELGFTFNEATRGDISGVEVTGGLFEYPEWTPGGPDWTLADVVDAVNASETYPLGVTALAGENGTYTLTERTAGFAGNQRVFTATGPFGSGETRQGSTVRGLNVTHYGIRINGATLDVEPAPVPKPLPADNKLWNRRVYIAASTAGLDLSSLAVQPYCSCELWLDYTAGSVTTPAAWSWVDGIELPATLTAGTRYFVTLKNDGAAVIAKLQFSYSHA